MKNNQNSYEFLDIKLLESIIKENDHAKLIKYASNLEAQLDSLPRYQEYKLREEIRDCQTIVLNYILSLNDTKTAEKLIHALFDNTDLYPEIYEKACARLIENKTPEEAMELYKIIKNRYFYFPSHTILKYVSSNTKKASTCLFFANNLEESYKKYGNKEYDDYILDFYARFKAVCTKEEFDQFVEFGTVSETNMQKQ